MGLNHCSYVHATALRELPGDSTDCHALYTVSNQSKHSQHYPPPTWKPHQLHTTSRSNHAANKLAKHPSKSIDEVVQADTVVEGARGDSSQSILTLQKVGATKTLAKTRGQLYQQKLAGRSW